MQLVKLLLLQHGALLVPLALLALTYVAWWWLAHRPVYLMDLHCYQPPERCAAPVLHQSLALCSSSSRPQISTLDNCTQPAFLAGANCRISPPSVVRRLRVNHADHALRVREATGVRWQACSMRTVVTAICGADAQILCVAHLDQGEHGLL